ncbi:kirola-like [Primulina eburnea]|uniref:kirola-like n=1 Tax=Primulina eburnea TaxID=1245227 RepID=UPI003C6C1B4F
MGLPCKLIAQVAFKAGGDVFHQILCNNPGHLVTTSPAKFQGFDLHQGTLGANGSVLFWKYTLDGKEQSCKQIIQDIDEVKKQITFKFIEGELIEMYKNLIITMHVETKNGIDYVTWTMEYEIIDDANPHPFSVLNFCVEFTSEIEHHIFGK